MLIKLMVLIVRNLFHLKDMRTKGDFTKPLSEKHCQAGSLPAVSQIFTLLMFLCLEALSV